MGSAAPARVVAFAPGRANLVGEHTDYNGGLSLPFAIAQGVRVTAVARERDEVVAHARAYGESARFGLPGSGERATGGGGEARDPAAARGGGRTGDWRDFVRCALAELAAAGHPLRGGELTIEGDLPQGTGLSSSAALEVALCLAVVVLGGGREPDDRVELARLCSRLENDCVGARTGLLDQLASLLGRDGHALRIDFRTLDVRPVPLALGGRVGRGEAGDWRLVAVDSGERRALAASGYNDRRAECERARELLGVASLRDASLDDAARLPAPFDRRVRHVVEENERVDAACAALDAGDLAALGPLLDASHASLRDLYEVSTDALERTVEGVRGAGAAGARVMGGGFGGQVLALLPPGAAVPAGAIELAPSAGARVLAVGTSRQRSSYLARGRAERRKGEGFPMKFEDCGDGVFAGPNTSCPFAKNVKKEYFAVPGDSIEIEVFSPVTHQTYTMACVRKGDSVTCRGGNNAVVTFDV